MEFSGNFQKNLMKIRADRAAKNSFVTLQRVEKIWTTFEVILPRFLETLE